MLAFQSLDEAETLHLLVKDPLTIFFGFLSLFSFFKDLGQVFKSLVLAVLQDMVENGVFQGQLQIWNLLLLGLS